MKRLALILLILFFDLGAKFFAVQRLPEDGGRLRFPIDFALHKNYGIAFDLPVPLWIVIPLTLTVLVILGLQLRRHAHDTRSTTALMLIAAGAVGNLLDRIAYSFTVDYIILFGHSAINLADVMILVGVAWLVLPTCRQAGDLDHRYKIKKQPRPE